MNNLCRICGDETTLYDVLTNHITSVTDYYNEPVKLDGVEIKIYHCEKCDHFQIQNQIKESYYNNYKMVFNPEDDNYSGYPETLLNYYKVCFEKLHKLTSEHENLLDVGCGAGDLLAILTDDYKNCVGIEPSKGLCAKAEKKGLNVANDYFNDSIKFNTKFDVITGMEVLEHIDNPNGFVKTVYNNLRDDGVIMFTVPNGQKIMRTQSYGDIFPEHLNYFTVKSITELLHRNQFELISIKESFGEDFKLTFFARKRKALNSLELKKNCDRDKLLEIVNKYDSIGIWGIGVRSRNILNLIANHTGNIKFLFDNNISLQGKYVPNISVPISKPESEKINECDAIIITSAEYKNEIKSELENKYQYSGYIYNHNI